MTREDLTDRLRAAIEQYARQHDLEIVECRLRPQPRVYLAQLLVDHPFGGVTIDECAAMNRYLTELLEQEDLEDYRVDVASPGLDRPLRNRGDFQRAGGRIVRFYLTEPLLGKKEVLALVDQAGEDEVVIQIQGQTYPVKYHCIAKAVIELSVLAQEDLRKKG